MRTGFTIHQRLPGLNEVIAANRTNKYAGAKLKKSTEEAICFEIIRAMRSGQLGLPGSTAAQYISSGMKRICAVMRIISNPHRNLFWMQW